MSLPSVRARITTWNVGIVALVLVFSGVTVRYLLQDTLLAAVDRDLGKEGRRAAGFFAFMHRPGPPRDYSKDRQTPRRDPFRYRPRTWPPQGPPSDPRGARRPPGTLQDREPDLRMRVLDLSGLDHRPGGAVGPWDTAAFTRSWRGEVVHTTVVTQGLELRVCSLPGVRDGRIEVVIQMVEPLAPTWRALDQLTQTLVILIPLALALAALGGAFLTGRALQPVREITEAADRIEAENLSQRLPFEGTDEFARLAAVLNGMLERLEAAFERQKRFTGDASHELRTPLATIKAASSLAREDAWGAEACQAAMASIEGAADRAGRIIEDLLLLARADSGRLIGSTRAVSIEQPLDQALRETAGAAGGAPDRAPVLIDLPDTPLLVRGEPQHLTRLFINLLENALRHTPATGEITVSTRADRQHVIVTVRDTGEGISLEHLPRLGERFYRADAARSRASGGAGLGLAICKSIVEAHQGSLEIDSVVGEGTVVTVTLPRDHAGE